jgi:hypothetical protein
MSVTFHQRWGNVRDSLRRRDGHPVSANIGRKPYIGSSGESKGSPFVTPKTENLTTQKSVLV